ncbi:MoaD/ThiS family protein [Thermasporomyces composti]|uniref:Molybdopterin converting factor small subunit n=1 Tax=Thermasporomyces composti TaxID=696763 RepID=A0A3D9V440_THECX|nr:MoaD/ThiS family protein [Thermasporomyces composti]REF36136.1 molybdopterin converting factor small subunit [Thermasporomyces composti]
MPSPVMVTVRYWAAAKEAAGLAEEQVRATTLAEALTLLRARHADRPRFAPVLAMCSVLIDGDPVGRRDPASVSLREGACVEVLPPFAGG